MKYRLKIPEMIRREEAHVVDCLIPYNGEILEYIECAEYKTSKGTYYGLIKKDWLEPIEDGPVSAEEWMLKSYPCKDCDNKRGLLECDGCSFDSICMIKAFKEGEQNHSKRTQPLIDQVKSGLSNANGLTPRGRFMILEALKTLEEP